MSFCRCDTGSCVGVRVGCLLMLLLPLVCRLLVPLGVLGLGIGLGVVVFFLAEDVLVVR